MDRGVWRAAVHGVVRSQTWLSTHTQYFYILELKCILYCFSFLMGWNWRPAHFLTLKERFSAVLVKCQGLYLASWPFLGVAASWDQVRGQEKCSKWVFLQSKPSPIICAPLKTSDELCWDETYTQEMQHVKCTYISEFSQICDPL